VNSLTSYFQDNTFDILSYHAEVSDARVLPDSVAQSEHVARPDLTHDDVAAAEVEHVERIAVGRRLRKLRILKSF